MEFPRKLAPTIRPSGGCATLAASRLPRAEESAVQTYLSRLSARKGIAPDPGRPTRPIDFLRSFLPRKQSPSARGG
jgi:hypothetical protein